jgi:hypothetical protein
MDKTEVASKLADALGKAQSEFGKALKDTAGQVGNQRYQYADLASINDATKVALSKYGLCITSKTLIREGQLIMETSLVHVSGEREIAVWPLVSGTQQQMGSAATYARRYTICALLNVVGETDDDGEAATAAGNTNVPKGKPQETPDTPFELVTGDGELKHYARGGEYLAGIELAFSQATDKAGFWESNQKHFAEWQVKYRGKPAGEQFNRIGKMIEDELRKIGESHAAA